MASPSQLPPVSFLPQPPLRTIDFRKLDEGFGGKTFKRKRAEQEAEKLHFFDDNDTSMEIDAAAAANPSKRQAVESSSDPNKPSFGRPTYDGVIAGKVSGKTWKEVRTRRASAVQVKKGTTAEQRSREKEIKKAYRERMNELKEEIRHNKQEKRRLREEREKKKQENILRSGTKLQKITNPKTLKKIAKSKQRNSGSAAAGTGGATAAVGVAVVGTDSGSRVCGGFLRRGCDEL